MHFKHSQMSLPDTSSNFMFYLFVPGILGFKCVGNKCDCVEEIKVVDCSRAGLKSTPQAKETLLNYSTLLLRFNALVEEERNFQKALR